MAGGSTAVGDADHRRRQRRFRLALLLAGAGAPARRLVARADGAGDVLGAVAGAPGAADLVALARRLEGAEVDRVLERVDRLGWGWAAPGDAGYPTLLGVVADPPLGLFIRGRVAWGAVVAVVGSRRATAYGQQVARLLGEELAAAGVVVASGMARGVDRAAHQGVLDRGGATVAVWGAGPDRVYPPEHGGLAEAIASTGALVTEYLPGTPPRPHHFPERNRILAGMSHAVVVVEAAARSGALVTARLALDEGREVLAVPGSIFSPQSLGPNALLRLGARPVLTPRDVLQLLPVADTVGHPPRPAREGWLSHGEALTVDELAERSGLAVEALSARLLELELEGEVERLGDGRYALR
jgi:DNA processing protein